MIFAALIAVLSYALGSIPFAKIISGVDLKKVGSGNVGTMNTLRVTRSVKKALAVLALDAGKGALAVAIAMYIARTVGMNVHTSIIISSLFVVCGHNWSMFEKFRSGRGIATSLGIALIVDWKIALVWIAIWFIGFAPTRIFSVGQVLAALLTPFALFILGFDKFYVYVALAACIPMFAAHVPKIPLILSGREPKMYYKLRR